MNADEFFAITNTLQEIKSGIGWTKAYVYTNKILLVALIILGLIILWNQRKIKKMLRDLQEQNRKDDDGSN